MKTISTEDILKLKADFAHAALQKITQTLIYSDKVYLYLSGGSTSLIYPLIFDDKLLAYDGIEKLVIAQIDERYDENAEHKDSNQRKIKHLVPVGKFYTKGVKFKFILEGEDAQTTENEYEKFLKKAFEDEDATHIGLLGVGADCHIAGLLPSTLSTVKNIEEKYFCAYDSKDFPVRMSLTFKSLRKLDYAFIYATGESKLEAIKVLESKETDLDKYPIQILNEMANCTLYTDQNV